MATTINTATPTNVSTRVNPNFDDFLKKSIHLNNIYYKDILSRAGESIKKGAPISKVFTENEKFYPIFLGEMMSVGEETGKIGEMLMGVAVFYEDDVEQKTKDMSTIIEPFLMVFIGAVVGFFAISMISPMYSLVNVI